jgi:protein-S-isoprenylcysteine O-methyltransferase Ste14
LKDKDLVPTVLSSVLLVEIVLLAIIRLYRIPNLFAGEALDFDLVFAGSYMLWIVAESKIARRDITTEGKRTRDAGSCPLYAVGQGLLVLSAFWFPSAWSGPNIAHLAGFVLFLLGIGYRLWAIHTLGPLYSHRVRTVSEHRIVDTGPYRFVRHPAYAGMIAAHAGLTLYFLNLVTVCILLFVLIPSILYRIAVEEKTLFAIDGYAKYAQGRKRLFPGVW